MTWGWRGRASLYRTIAKVLHSQNALFLKKLGERAIACQRIAEKIAEISGIETVLFDERLTTTSAHKFLNINDIRGKKRKNTVDAVAATLILEDYLKFIKK